MNLGPEKDTSVSESYSDDDTSFSDSSMTLPTMSKKLMPPQNRAQGAGGGQAGNADA